MLIKNELLKVGINENIINEYIKDETKFLSILRSLIQKDRGLAYRIGLMAVLPIKIKDTNNIQEYGIIFNILVHSCVHEIGRDNAIPIIEKLLDKEISVNGKNYWVHEHKSHVLFSESYNDIEAYYNYTEAALKSMNLEKYHLSYGTSTIKPFSENYNVLDNDMLLGKTEENVYDNNEFTKFNLVHLVSCDSVYFIKYFKKLVSSYSLDSLSNTLINCCVINPNYEVKVLAEELAAKYSNIVFDFTIKEIPENCSTRWLMAYYACARFLRIKSALNRFSCTVFVTDIDCLLSDDVNKIFSLLGKNPVGLCTGIQSLKSYYPWTKVSAGFSIFNNSIESRKFVDYLQQYISANFNLLGDSQNWGIDQTGFYYALIKMQENYSDFNFAKLKLRDITSDQNNRY